MLFPFSHLICSTCFLFKDVLRKTGGEGEGEESGEGEGSGEGERKGERGRMHESRNRSGKCCPTEAERNLPLFPLEKSSLKVVPPFVTIHAVIAVINPSCSKNHSTTDLINSKL